MPNEHRADQTPPPHHGQGRGGSKKESFSLRVSPALHPPERPSPHHAVMAGHALGLETRERQYRGGNILYTYTNRHAEPPNIAKHVTLLVIIYNDSVIEPYKNRGLGQQ